MRCASSLLALCVASGSFVIASAEIVIGSPGFPPSKVTDSGVIQEDWGSAQLRLVADGAQQPKAAAVETDSVPAAQVSCTAGPIQLAQTIYRAPIWPEGADVLLAKLTNSSGEKTPACFELVLPEESSVGDRFAIVGGRVAVALPHGIEPVRKTREWGCTGGVVPLPGWAKPSAICDPAFANISAGMGGVPIEYRFSVTPGARRTVVLGFCESHHSDPSERPLMVEVEGAPQQEVNPIAQWGRHGAGCLRFDAIDGNQDGVIAIIISPHRHARDKNTILNVIWVFDTSMQIDLDKVAAGAQNAQAEHYVDVGGASDQLLYEGGSVRYDMTLEPHESRELLFLLSSPGSSALPDLANTAWTPASLWDAARDVWEGQKPPAPAQ